MCIIQLTDGAKLKDQRELRYCLQQTYSLAEDQLY